MAFETFPFVIMTVRRAGHDFDSHSILCTHSAAYMKFLCQPRAVQMADSSAAAS